MFLPAELPVNVMVDIYRAFSVGRPLPTGRPDVAAVPGHLRHHVKNGRFGYGQSVFWTHLLYLPVGTDVRSGYSSNLGVIDLGKADTIVVHDYPIDRATTVFLVVMVQRASRGTGGDVLKVYLDRAGQSAPCCADLPRTLKVTFSDISGSDCACLNGSFPIVWNPATGKYAGTFSACGGVNTFQLWCESPGAGPFGFAWSLQGANGPLFVDRSAFAATCHPFELNFLPVGDQPLSNCCTTTGQTFLTITT
jgi:hypothetical protein